MPKLEKDTGATRGKLLLDSPKGFRMDQLQRSLIHDDRVCLVVNLGTVDYQEAFALQTNLRDLRIAGSIPDALILLEHPPLITIGRSGNEGNIRVPTDTLIRQGIGVYRTNRGGDVTYHGPGQMVGYTIVDLRFHRMGPHTFLRKLEQVIINTLQEFDIGAGRLEGLTGVWVGQEKIASIGIHLKQWITMHGFSLNVNPDLSHFRTIYPCGIKDKSITSMAQLLGKSIDPSDVRKGLSVAFCRAFGLKPKEGRVSSSAAIS